MSVILFTFIQRFKGETEKLYQIVIAVLDFCNSLVVPSLN